MFKRRISLILLICFVVTAISFVNADVGAELINLAAGKSVTVSGGTGDGSLLTDGIIEIGTSTTWQSSETGIYATINLEKSTEFNTLKIYELSADTQRLNGYKIEVSSDNESWKTVLESDKDYIFTEKNGYANFEGILSFEKQTAQYVKFTVKALTKKFFIKEIEIYNDPDAEITVPPVDDGIEEPEIIDDSQNFARGKSVTVSNESIAKGYAEVTDGIRNVSGTGHAWNISTKGANMVIDLGQERSFDCVVVYEYSFNRTKGYSIDVSEDNVAWTNVVPKSDEILSAFGGVTSAKSNAPHYYGKFLFDKTTARYVKISIDEISEGNWAYIEEIEVYDQTNMPEIEEGEEPVNITLDPPVVVNDIPYSDENFHIYLFLGQSNMSGVGKLLKEDYVVIDDAYLLNADGNWELAQPYPNENSTYKNYQGFNRYSNIMDASSNPQTNPALSFTRAVRKNISDDTGIGIICNARGGTYISQWQKDHDAGVDEEGNPVPNMFEKTVERTKAALAKGGVLKGIFWIQGELCAGKDGYLDKLNTMVVDLREELGVNAEDVPFIAGQYLPLEKFDVHNETISKISTVVANSDYISSEGTTSTGDDLHYDAESQRLLGVRFAEKIMPKVYNKSMTATQLYNSVYNPDAFESDGDLSSLSSYIKKQTTVNCYVLGTDVDITVYSKSTAAVTAPTVIYIVNHNMERIGLEDDLSILTDFINDGYAVVLLDYKNSPLAVSPKLENSIFEIRKNVDSGALLEGTGITIEENNLFVVPSGYRLRRNVPYWDYYKHAPNGVLNNIVKSYNEKVVPEFGKDPVTLETILDMERPDGSPVDFSLRMDITYPSKTNKETPVMMIQSTLTHRRRNEATLTGGVRYHYIGFLLNGYVYVNYDHSWNPLAQKDHYGYDMFVYGSTMANSVGIATNSAAVRYIKANAETFNADVDHIGVWGHSKSSQGSLQLSNPHHMEWTERNTAVWNYKDANGETGPREEQPWQGYDSIIAASYQTMGTGTRDYASGEYISDEDAKDQVPTISACGERDEYGAWEYWPDQKARYERMDIPVLTFDMYNLGHVSIQGFDKDYQIDRYEALFKFFDGYLKPESAPKVIYTLPYNGKTEILPDEVITVKFAPNMADDTIDSLSVVRVSDGTVAKGEWTKHQRGSLFKWTPSEEMAPGEEYEIRVGKEAENTNGVSLGNDYVSTFKIADINAFIPEADASVKYGSAGENKDTNFGSDDYIILKNVSSDVKYENIALSENVTVTIGNLSPNKQSQRINDGVTESAGTTASTNDENILWAKGDTFPSIKYDLGKEYSVDKVVVHTADFSKNRCAQFKIEMADDANFTTNVQELGTFSNTEGIPNDGAVVDFSSPVSLRYIRFTSMGNVTTGYVYFTEFEVYGYIFDENSSSSSLSSAAYSSKGYIKFTQDRQFTDSTYAELRFTTVADPDSGGISGKDIDIYGLIGEDEAHLWSETEINWENAPANNTASQDIKTTNVFGGTKIATVKNTQVGEYIVNVTDYIKSLEGKTATFILVEAEGSLETTPATYIVSKEGASENSSLSAPQLLVTFEAPSAKITVKEQYNISTKNSEISFTCDNFVIDTATLNNAVIREISGKVKTIPEITAITENEGTVSVRMSGLKKGGVYTLDMSKVKSTDALTLPDITFATESSINYSVQFTKDVNKKMTARVTLGDGSEKYISQNQPLLVMAKYNGTTLTGIKTKKIESQIWFYDDFNHNGDTPPASKETGWSGAGSTSVYYNGSLPDGIPGQPLGIKRALVSAGESGAYRLRNVEAEYGSSYVEAWFYDDGVINSSTCDARYGALWTRVTDENGENLNLFAGLRDNGNAYKFTIGSSTVAVGKSIPRKNGWYKVAFDFSSGNGFRVLINDIQVYPNPDEEGVEEGDTDSTYTSFNRFSVGSNGWKGVQAPYGLAMAKTSAPGNEVYDISLENVEDSETVKLYIWDSLSGLQPIGNLIEREN